MKEGVVYLINDNKKREDYYTFLFTDMIIFTKKQTTSSILTKKRSGNTPYQYHGHAMLYRALIEPDGN